MINFLDLTTHFVLLAQEQTRDDRFVLEESALIAKESATAFDKLWQVLVLQESVEGVQLPNNTGIYSILTQLGLFLAVGTLLLFMVQWARQLLEGDIERPLTDFVWPILVALLLSNQGKPLAQMTVAVRDLINYVNHSVLVVLDQTLDIDSTLAGVANLKILQSEMADIVSQCDKFSEDFTKLKPCQEAALKDLEKLKDEYAGNPNEFLKQRGLSDLEAQKQILMSAEAPVSPIPRDAGLQKISTSMLALGGAFQRSLESCMLITAVIGPLAVGASLTPLGTKPCYGWLSSLLALGLAKLAYNLLNAVVVMSVYFIGTESNYLYQDFAMGALNPLIAFGLAIGGGKSLFDGLTTANARVRAGVYGEGFVTSTGVRGENKRG